MLRTFSKPTTFDEQKIKDLEHELEMARWDIINLMPENRRKILMSFFHCESRSETYGWKEKITEELIGTAEVIGSPFGDRAYCPLCGDGSSSGYERGYSLPIGLTRHLTGWGRTRECTVVKAASAIARDFWNDKFSPAEREQDTEKAELLVKRRASELLFNVAPERAPLLFDERLYFGGVPRNQEEMTWAEQRLGDLGFRTVTSDKVRSYIDEQEHYIVYADLRVKGRIDFAAYRRRASKRAGAKPSLRAIGTFRIPDIWKNDLLKKYQEWIGKTTAELIERPPRVEPPIDEKT